MMNTSDENEIQDSTLRQGNKWDLFLYIFGIFGLFIGASLIISLIFNLEEITLTVSLISILMNVVFIGGGTFVFGILRQKISWQSLGIYPFKWKRHFLPVIFILAIGLMPIRAIIGGILEEAVSGGYESLETRMDLFGAGMDTWYGNVLLFVGIGILAPIAEELFFRGLIYDWFRQRAPIWLSVLVSSVIFGFAHFDSVGVAVSAFIMGIVLAVAYERTKSLWVSIGIHIVTNSIAYLLILVIYLMDQFLDYDLFTAFINIFF